MFLWSLVKYLEDLRTLARNLHCNQIMSYLCQKCKKMGVSLFVSEIERVGNYHDFENLARVIQRGLQVFIVNNYSPK